MSSSFTCAFFLLGLVPSLYTAAAASIGSGTGLKHEYRITQRDNISGPTVNGPKMGGANFPDPSLIFANGSWYAFATGSGNAHIQVASSTDFNDWNRLQFDAMPDITAAKWATQSVSATRSPDVVQLNDNSFVMYFAATTAQNSSRQCVGAARSTYITGPYKPDPDPLYCPIDQGGATDPSGYSEAGGQRFVLYKVDGTSLIGRDEDGCPNSVETKPTPIMLQAVGDDGTTPVGTPYTVQDHTVDRDHGNIDGPSLVKAPDNSYVLFFNSGCKGDYQYSIAYATSQSVFGPYTRAADPLFGLGTDGVGNPGSADIWSDGQHMLLQDGGQTNGLITALVNIKNGKVTTGV